MIIVKDWILESRTVRTVHLKLDEPCIERGGNSTVHRGVLAQFLDTDLPNKVDLCHACHNGLCSNPRHLYWGTRTENINDMKANGNFINPYQRLLNKHGPEKIKEIILLNGSTGWAKGGRANKGKKRIRACTPAAEG